MNGVQNTDANSKALLPFVELPDDAIRNIVTFCNTSTGVGLSATCRGLRHLLLEEVRKVQIVLISRVAEGIEKSGLLKDDARRGLIERKDRAVEAVQNAESLEVIAAMGASVFRRREDIVLPYGIKLLPPRDEIKWLPPFVSIVDGHPTAGHHFIPPYLETTICQLMVETARSYVPYRSSLQEAIRLMREGRFDQTEESTKVERDGKSCILAGLAKAAIKLQVMDRLMDRPLFFDIHARIERKEVREEFLLFCIKNTPKGFVSEIENFLMEETFFFSLSTKTQIQVMEKVFPGNNKTILNLALRSSDLAVKKKALELAINAGDCCLSPLTHDTLFLTLDIRNSIPLAKRKGHECALLERFEEIYRPYPPEFLETGRFWNRELCRIGLLPGSNHLCSLRVIMKDDRWRIEPPAKMVEEWWELLSHFPLNQGCNAYGLFMHAASCIQCETPGEEMSNLINIIFDKVNRMEKREDKKEFINLIDYWAISFLESLTIEKSRDFINYELFMDQIRLVIRGIVKDERSELEKNRNRTRLVRGIVEDEGNQLEKNWNRMLSRILDREPNFFRESGRRCYPYFYILAGKLQEVFQNGVEKDWHIMRISRFYKAYNMKEDALAQKMMGELVDQIEDQEIKREVLLLLV